MTKAMRAVRRAAITAAALAAIGAGFSAVPATLSAQAVKPGDDWLTGLQASHKQFFDTPAAGGGVPLIHVLNYYDTYNKAYNVKDADIDAVLGLYGMATFYAVNDAMWKKYELGEFLQADGPTAGTRAVANPWRATPTIMGMSLPQASVESLQKRGATFIVCNNALSILSGMVAQKRGLEPAAVYADMNANLLPGVYLVPGMVVAIEQAQKAGLSYHRQ